MRLAYPPFLRGGLCWEYSSSSSLRSRGLDTNSGGSLPDDSSSDVGVDGGSKPKGCTPYQREDRGKNGVVFSFS